MDIFALFIEVLKEVLPEPYRTPVMLLALFVLLVYAMYRIARFLLKSNPSALTIAGIKIQEAKVFLAYLRSHSKRILQFLQGIVLITSFLIICLIFNNSRIHNRAQEIVLPSSAIELLFESSIIVDDMDDFIANMTFSEHELYDEAYEWSDMPSHMQLYPDQPDAVYLTFIDELGKAFYFVASYQYENGKITFYPYGGIMKGHTPKLPYELTYDVLLKSDNSIQFTDNNRTVTMKAVRDNDEMLEYDVQEDESIEEKRLIDFGGKAIDTDNRLEGIQFIRIIDGNEDTKETGSFILFSNGNMAFDLKISYDSESSHMLVRWEKEYQTLKNKRIVVNTNKEIQFDFFDTKQGVLLIVDDKVCAYKKYDLPLYDYCEIECEPSDILEDYTLTIPNGRDGSEMHTVAFPIPVEYFSDIEWDYLVECELLEANTFSYVRVNSEYYATSLYVTIYNPFPYAANMYDCMIWGIDTSDRANAEDIAILSNYQMSNKKRADIIERFGIPEDNDASNGNNVLTYRLKTNSYLKVYSEAHSWYRLSLYPWDYPEKINFMIW